MRRWISRALPALLVGIGLPAVAAAQTLPPTTPPVTPPAATAPTLPTPAPGAANGTVVVVPNGVIYMDPYHAATPFNPTVVNQAMPNPALNRPVTTLPCDIPNQNLDAYVPKKPGCKGWFQRKSGCGCGAGGACDPTPSDHPVLHEIAHPTCGACSKGGSCTTCCNTHNFVFASSRSFFGETSREFFERPPSIDGVKMCPKSYYPPPAPGAYIPPDMVVAKPAP